MKRLLGLALVVCAQMFAQSAAPLLTPKQQFFDNNGYPLAGGLIYTCVAGSSCPGTPLASYTDSTAGTPNANPVVLDAAGRAAIWGGANAYKIVVQDSGGNTLATQDNVPAGALQVSATFTGSNGATLIKYTALGSSTSRTLAAKLGDTASVLDYGAKGDGVTDDTSAINAALVAAHNVFFPDGTYALTCDSTTDSRFTAGGIAPQSNSTLTFGGNAVLKCKANASGYYAAIRLYGVSNVWIYGGALDGNKSAVTASSATQSGMGVVVRGASNVWIYGTVAHDFWGDGFYIDRISAGDGSLITNSTNINVSNVLAQNNRRQGMSIQMVDGMKITSSTFSGTCCNTGPGDGIDIEPDFNLNSVNDVQIIDSTFSNNIDAPNGNGDGLALTCPAGLGTISNVSVLGGKSTGNGAYGIRINGNQCSGIRIQGMDIENNVSPGILATNVADGAVSITGNYLAGNSNNVSQGGSQNSNVLITSSTGVRFTNNVVRKGSNTTKPTYGLNMQSNTNNFITNNDLAGSSNLSANEWLTVSDSPYFCGNRLTSGMQQCVLAAISGATAINNTAAANGAATTPFVINNGADGTLGGLGLSFVAFPSATGTSRWAAIVAGDSAAVRPLILNYDGAGHFGRTLIGTTTDDGSTALQITGTASTTGNVTVKSGGNVVYRCTTAGTLPVGALTIVTGNCGAANDTGLRIP